MESVEQTQQNDIQQEAGKNRNLSGDELEKLAAEYPQAAGEGGVNIPGEVLELKNGGMGLLEAYRLYDLKKTRAECSELKQKLDAAAAEKRNGAASTGSVAGGNALQKDFYSPLEWDSLSPAVKRKFIESGKVYEFMKNWKKG